MRVVDDLQKPNGIIGTPDGKTLYVADIGAGRPTGTTSRPTAASQARRSQRARLDGITLDNEGNLYLTGNGVLVVDKGPADRADPGSRRAVDRERQLRRQGQAHAFITASTGLYAVRMRVKSANAAK